jgi:CxxC motif-containing protein (DUF1111 family)
MLLTVKRVVILAVACAMLPVATLARDNGYSVKYDGGSLPGLKAGTGVRLFIDQNQIRILKGHSELVTIPAFAVTEISYGQDVHRRVGAAVAVGVVTLGIGALTALTKSKKHYLGLTWAAGNSKGGITPPRQRNARLR